MNKIFALAYLCAVIAIATACGNLQNQGGGSTSTSASTQPAGDSLLAAVKQRGTLVVATDANYKPQSFRNPDGTWTGFDVDVAREIAKRLGVTPQFETTNFDAVTAGSWNGQWDINVGSMAITPKRAKVLWFTQPYYFTPASFAVNRNSAVTTIAGLAGKKIGVGVATTYEQYLKRQLFGHVPPPQGTTVITYATDVPALQDLALGNGVKLDGVLSALTTIRAGISSGMALRIIQPPVFDDSSAIALDRESALDSRPLLWAVDGIVHDMHADGTLRRLSLKYYGIDLSVRH
jgi:polar amino acid transport system substrate-binding protein